MSACGFGVFGVGPHLVGIPAMRVLEMFVLPRVSRPPNAPAHQRGVVTLRGAAMPAIDLRVCLGMVSAFDELESQLALMKDREQDHRNWLAELEASVREDREFTLATDPRKCKFGQWYYAFRTDDAVLRGELRKIEQPHAQIHALAEEVEALVAAGRHADAMRVVEHARGGLLSEVVRIFDQIRQAMRTQHREVGVKVELGGRRATLIVDRAEVVANLEEVAGDGDPLASGDLRTDLLCRVAFWKGSKQPVLLLDLDRIAEV